MSIDLLPGAVLTPTVLLHQTLSSADRIAGVIVITTDPDGIVDVSWSNMTRAQMAFAAMRFMDKAQEVLRGDDLSVVYEPRA